jgi:hypothetical protein
VGDRKKIFFGVLSVVQSAMVGAIPLLAASREPAVNWLLYGISGAMLVAGPALVFGGRAGRAVAAIACMIHLVAGLVFAVLVVGSASYLLGIYGRHGQSIGALALVLAAFVAVLFWLIPAHQLHYLRRSAER